MNTENPEKENQGKGVVAALLFFYIPVFGYFLIRNSFYPTWFKIPMYVINLFITVWMIASIFNGKCI